MIGQSLANHRVGRTATLGLRTLPRGNTDPFRGLWKRPALKARLGIELLNSDAFGRIFPVGRELETEMLVYSYGRTLETNPGRHNQWYFNFRKSCR